MWAAGRESIPASKGGGASAGLEGSGGCGVQVPEGIRPHISIPGLRARPSPLCLLAGVVL